MVRRLLIREGSALRPRLLTALSSPIQQCVSQYGLGTVDVGGPCPVLTGPGGYRCCSISSLAIAWARLPASVSPAAAQTIDPFIRMCQERVKESVARRPASSAS